MKNKKYAGINVTSILEEAEVFLLIEKRVSVYNFKKLPELGTYVLPLSFNLSLYLTTCFALFFLSLSLSLFFSPSLSRVPPYVSPSIFFFLYLSIYLSFSLSIHCKFHTLTLPANKRWVHRVRYVWAPSISHSGFIVWLGF